MPFKQNKKGGKSQRTVDSSSDGVPTQSIAPEAAARYLQQATSNNSNREVKISFGPSRPPSLETLKETAARAGLPCSEAEMKTLMGMFVEIMGMGGMDGKKGAVDIESISKAGALSMMFGRDGPSSNWPDHESLAAATAGLFADGASWDAIRKSYGAVYSGSDRMGDDCDDDDDDDNESIPDLDDMQSMDLKQVMASRDWEALRKIAVDTFDAEERARNAAKSREKKQRKKQKQREDAAAREAENAQRQREMERMSWRSQIVLACQSQDATLLDMLIDESPFLDDDNHDNDILPHLEFLIPYALPKSRNHVDTGKEIRCKLASYLLDEELHMAFEPMQNGRPILHAACFLGDLAIVELVLDKLEQYFQAHSNDRHPFLGREDLDITCADTGWAALHYAALSGSAEVLEVLLRSGCNVTAITDASFTCTKSGRKGITALDLIDFVKEGTYHDALETRGLALQEIHNTFLANTNDHKVFLKSLENASKRIHEVEINGYIVPGLLGDVKGPSGAAKKRKKKKKKKQNGEKDSEVSNETSVAQAPKASLPISAAKEAPPEDFADPLVTALLGMGFANDEILAAVEACGGSSRATADDLVTWILGQGADGGVAVGGVGSSEGQSPGKLSSHEADDNKVNSPSAPQAGARAADERRRQEEAAKRLAEKREEQRRRNREWNNREQARQQQAKVYTAPKPTPQPDGPHGPSPKTVSNTTLQTGVALKPPLAAGPKSTTLPSSVKKASTAGATHTVKDTTPPPQAVPSSIPDLEFPSLSESTLPVQKQPPKKTRAAPLATVPVVTTANSFPPLGDDDRTVSSFGSNRGLSVSSAPFLPQGLAPAPAALSTALPPPGFMHPSPFVAQDPWKPEPSENDMRVTAPEFVPTKSVMGNPLSQPNVSSLASLPGSYGLEALLESTRPENSTSRSSSDGLLSQGFLGPSSTVASFLGTGTSQSERMPSVTPVSEDTTTLSVGSSFTAIPGFDDPSAMSSGSGAYGLYLDKQPHGANTSSLLTPTFTNQPSSIGDSLWGALAPSNAGPSLVGLPSLNFGSAGVARQNSNDDKDCLSQSWATPLNGNGPGGSIW